MSAYSCAEQMRNSHHVGFQAGSGGVEYEERNSDGQGVGHSYLYYNYQFIPHYYLEAGVLAGGDINNWGCKNSVNGNLECRTDDSHNFEFNADSFDYNALTIAFKTDLKLSKRNKLYGKFGAEFYEYEFKFDHQKTIDEDGVGLLLEAGWEYRWDNGMGINASMQYHDMSDLEMRALNIGVSYAF